MATAAGALTLIETKLAPQAEIDSYLDAREKARSAGLGLDEEIAKVTADLAKQVVSQAVGKPKLDTDAILTQYKAAKTKQDQLQGMKGAVAYLLTAVNQRLLSRLPLRKLRCGGGCRLGERFVRDDEEEENGQRRRSLPRTEGSAWLCWRAAASDSRTTAEP